MNISWLSKLPAACEYGIPSGGGWIEAGRTTMERKTDYDMMDRSNIKEPRRDGRFS